MIGHQLSQSRYYLFSKNQLARMNSNRILYLDHNATTPVDPRVLEEMLPFFTGSFANASSTHKFGVVAHDAVKLARRRIADLIKAGPNEIIFTSGATEAINLALKGVAEQDRAKGNHIITVRSEHSAVLDTCEFLETKGFEVTFLDVDKDGLIDLQQLQKELRPSTILVAIMMVNNETGVIQPIKEIARLTHDAGALFFTDATQAYGKLSFDVDEYDIDLLSISAHKMYGPKGAGALFMRQRGDRRVKLPALIHGGGHERGTRSGTLNVPGIAGMGKAAALAKAEGQKDAVRIQHLRDYLEAELLKIADTKLNGHKNARLFNISNICFAGVDSEALIMGLSEPQHANPLIAVSNGSACTSTSILPSHVLTAMGRSEAEAFSSIRFSLGKNNSREEMDIAIAVVKETVASLRAMTA
jgi:cysteine desulfurase